MTVVPGTTTILGLGLFKPHGMLTVEGAVEVGTTVVAVVVIVGAVAVVVVVLGVAVVGAATQIFPIISVG